MYCTKYTLCIMFIKLMVIIWNKYYWILMEWFRQCFYNVTIKMQNLNHFSFKGRFLCFFSRSCKCIKWSRGHLFIDNISRSVPQALQQLKDALASDQSQTAGTAAPFISDLRYKIDQLMAPEWVALQLPCRRTPP